MSEDKDTIEMDLTPNYKGIFNGMLREARLQAKADLFECAGMMTRIEALRDCQRWFAPLTVAAQCMTTGDDVAKLRHLMAEILAEVERVAGDLESETAKRKVAEEIAERLQ